MTSTPSPKAASVSQGVPDGWKRVPIEPTDVMMDAAIALIETGPCFPQDIYAAMLSASPEAPSLDAAVPASGGVDAAWQGMETAPRDGTWFEAITESGYRRRVHFAEPDDRLPIDHSDEAWSTVPTKWRALTEPVSEPAGGVREALQIAKQALDKIAQGDRAAVFIAQRALGKIVALPAPASSSPAEETKP